MRRRLIGAVAAVVAFGLSPSGSAVADPGVLSVEATKHMVKECRQQHENLASTIDEILVEMETAQRSLDAARTRAVLELSQMRLADLKQDLALCANLLNMIDRRTSEHQTSQREQELGTTQQDTSQTEQGQAEFAK